MNNYSEKQLKDMIDLEKNLIKSIKDNIKDNNKVIADYKKAIKRLQFDSLNCKNAIKICRENIKQYENELKGGK